ncbi:MAG TPA: alpha/beta hydrolase [Anaerolineales bacterium]|nr:alpha/beta hydrolase [Anaerolineales bacterium]
MIILATILSALSLLMGVQFFVQNKPPGDALPFGWFAKLIAGALSPFWGIMGAVGAVVGWIYQAYWAIPMGILGAGTMLWYIWQSTRSHAGFEKAFGTGWSNQIPSGQTRQMLQKRWTLFTKKPSPAPVWERDVAFWTIPGTGRDLLCDIWRPADGNVSGLAMVFFHGGSWTALDKDFGTRPFFRHLAAQGHTVMDVSYRLCPEVDFFGMMEDVKRAVAWMKENASRYAVNPEKIVIAGNSTGGHIAMLGGYAPNHPELTPEDLIGIDLSVCGVISFYGPTDMLNGYSLWNVKQRSEKLPPVSIGSKLDPNKAFLYGGLTNLFLGGHPEDIPEVYQLASPTTHVHHNSPPTLLIQGDKDLLVPLKTTLAHFKKLVECGVPAIKVVYPWTEHGFDLLLPQTNPAAQSALYDVDRFLAILANK